MMTANPDPTGFFGANEGSIKGVLNALKETGNEGKIVAIGYDSGQQQIDAITSGVEAGAITQNPIGIGAKCVDAAIDAINGKTLPKTIDTGFSWFDKTNINNPEIQLDLRVVDVGLVEPGEAGVDGLRQGLAVDRVDRRVDALRADADRVLGDRAGLDAAGDRVDLLLAGVVADGHDLALVAGLLERVEDALDGALVGAEEALEVGVGRHHRLGDVGGLDRVARAVLGREDFDVRVLRRHLGEEPVTPGDAGLAGLVVDDDADRARVADKAGHVVGGVVHDQTSQTGI